MGSVYALPSVRFTDNRGFIWQVDVATGAVGPWPQPLLARAGNPAWAPTSGFAATNCTGAEYLVLSSPSDWVAPRYVFAGVISPTYWVRPDNLQIQRQVLGSVQGTQNGCGIGCEGPAYACMDPNPWPTQGFYSLPAAAMVPSPPITKPPDFVGPLHLEPQ